MQNQLKVNLSDVGAAPEAAPRHALTQLRTQLLELIVQSRLSLDELLAQMIKASEATYPGLTGSVLLMEPDGRHLRHAAAPSLPQAYLAAIDGIEIGPCVGSCGTAAYRAEEVIVSDIANDPLWQDYKALALSHGLAACYSEPIVDTTGKVLGTFAMYWPRPREATANDLETIRMMAKVASLAIERQQADQSLRESEQRYQDLYDSAPDMFVSVDGATGYVLNCNQTLTRTLGYSKQEIVGQPVFALYHPNSLVAAQQIFEHFAKGGEVCNAHLQLLRKDGVAVDVSLNTSAVRDAQGNVLYSRSIWRDITAQKSSDDAHQKTQQMLQSLLDHSPAVVYIKTPDGKYLLINHLFETLFNLTREQVIGKTDLDIFPKESAEAFRRQDIRALESKQHIQMEETAPAIDGPRDYLSVKFALKDVSGAVFAMGGISTDVTEQKRAAKHAAQTQQLLNDAFERVTDAFVALDRNWCYTYVNARAAAIIGRTQQDLIGKHIWTEFPEGVGQPFQQAYERAMAEQQPVHFEQYYPPYDRWFMSIVYPSAHGLSIYFQDVTDQKKAELALEEHQLQLEQTVQERTAELSDRIDQMRRFALLTADRELRIQKLRHENEKLKQQLASAGSGARSQA